MTSGLTTPSVSSNLPTTSNQIPPAPDPTVGVSARGLCERVAAARHATSTLLQDTKWPLEVDDAAQNLLQTITNLPDLPADIIPIKDTAEQLMRALEATHVSVKKASEKYGKKERGFKDGIKYKISSLHRGECTKILQTHREDIDKVSATFRTRLDSVAVPGRLGGTETPSGPQNHLAVPAVQAEGHLESSLSSLSSKAKSEKHLAGSGHPTSHPASVPNLSPELPADQEDRRPIRDGVIIAAKKTFKAVEIVSGAIPAVGDFVGVAAKVGLAFVEMIETMDQNEDVSKELAVHTSKMSTYLDYFKKKVDVDIGDDLVVHINNLHKELGCVQRKVRLWNSSGRLKKAFLASDHAEELKGYQDTIQTALEELQLLVSLNTADVVIELKNTELRAERRRLLNCLGDGNYGARGNSIEDVACLPGTRVGVLDRINKWIKDMSPSSERVLWIRGMAGRGKSAIASTVAHNWASKGSCAIFHFRRGQNALDGQFICALVRQLGKGLVPEVKNAVLDCVRENEDIARERLDQQFKTLLVGSLGKIQDHAHPIVIVIDALDECNNVTDTVRFVRLIDQHSSLIPANVKFLLTCRPEAPLLVALQPRKWHAEDLDSIPDVSEDITRFVQHACEQIRDDHGLPKSWPSPDELKGVVEMSQGLFQWARTAISYIGDGSPADRLQDLLQRSSMWVGLDELYHQILSKAFKKAETDSVREKLLSWVLGTLVVAPYPVSLDVIAFLYADYEILVGRADMVQFLRNDILADLNSLIHISTSSSEPMRLMHTSIRDSVTTRRCKDKPYFVDLTQDHRRLATVCLQIMGRDLMQNICCLPDISKSNSEVQNEVNRHVCQGLRYCCQSWAIHLTNGVTWSEAVEATSVVLAKFQLISDKKLLPWLEVMSLIGATIDALTMAKRIDQWLLHCPQEMSNKSLSTLWNDTQRFIAAFYEPISFGALHIYASGLPQCPVGTMLWAKYGNQATSRILLGKRQLNWPTNIWTSSATLMVNKVAFSPGGGFLASGLGNGTIQLLDAQTGAPLGEPLTGHSKSITSIVFSPDGKTLASGSDDRTVRLWDAQTGAPLGEPLTGHSQSITSVVFSPDGKTLASGSYDSTIRLWDAQTGASLGEPLTSHSDWVRSVVFSSDGKILASGSGDKTVRLWDAQTGALLGEPLTGHSDWIRSVVFSPDGKTLASGSDDNTVRIWDAQTGAPLGEPLTGHSSWIMSVVFSPDGKTLASGSGDKTVQLWDAQTGAPLGEPLTGHSQSVTSVVFSPDGKTLASGSYDKTVRLWDAQTGASLGEPLTGHSDWITSIVFSPDGKILASWLDDEIVRLWDAQTGAPLGEPLTGHSGSITSIVFSPDGKTLASGSDDETIRLWDAQTGVPLGEPLTGHSESITSVLFSPDGKTLASGSDDETVRLWDAQTGAPLGEPLTGHSESITSIVFSPDGKTLASGSDDETVRLWDAQTGVPLGEPLTGHSNWIRSVVFSPDGRTPASGLFDKTIRLWDAQTGAPLGEPVAGHSSRITSIVFSPDSKTLASGLDHKTVQLWDAQTGAPLGEPLTGHSGRITSFVFSQDSKTLVSGSADNTVRLWDAQTGTPLGKPLTGHSDLIRSVVFSPDGKTLASGSRDNTVRLWDAQTGATLGEPPTGGSEVLAPGGLHWVLPWARKSQIFDDLPRNLIPQPIMIRSNWVVCGSKRVMWLDAHYRTPSLFAHVLSPGRFAVARNGIYDVFDVSTVF